MSKKSSSASSRFFNPPSKDRRPHYASPNSTCVSTALIGDVSGPLPIDPGVLVLKGSRTFAPFFIVSVDHQSGAIIAWKVTI